MKNKLIAAFAIATVFSVAATPASADFSLRDFFAQFFAPPVEDPAPAETIVDLAVATPELSTLVQAVLKAELAGTLAEGGDFTVFAPTNQAFMDAGIDPANVDPATLTAVLLDHVVAGDLTKRFLRGQGRNAERVPTLGGLQLSFDAMPFAVNGARVLGADVPASNGRVYLIDTVLLRPAPSIAARAIANPGLSTLVEAVVKAGLAETLDTGGPFTAFVPSNAAFEAAGIDPAAIDAATLEAVLLDHVVAGEFSRDELLRLRFSESGLQTLGGLNLEFGPYPLSVNGIRILRSNVTADNGVIHVIDGVLIED